MPALQILHYPDPRLRTSAHPVKSVDAGVQALVRSMFETMYAAPGIGLAATQVNVHLRVIVIDVSADRSEPVCLINPEMLETGGSCETNEGCLSVPDVFEAVRRAESVQVRALNEHGDSRVLHASGLLAVCIQHELDHLEGKLFVDRLSELKRGRIRKKFDKAYRRAG